MSARPASPRAPHGTLGVVVAVCSSPTYTLRKPVREAITLMEGLGVDDDVHAGMTVKHRSRMKRDPMQPNLRQVHLIHAELHDALQTQGFTVGPGDMGENVTTRGLALLALPVGTRLRLGEEAVIELTGLRNPCAQLDEIQPGLMEATLERDAGGMVRARKAGVMSVVRAGGTIRPGDAIRVVLPPPPHQPLAPV